MPGNPYFTEAATRLRQSLMGTGEFPTTPPPHLPTTPPPHLLTSL
ncbi:MULTISPECIES: hypothetical protein [Fischerella]|nr:MULTISPECIES: hypothetical protein [Fischerella]